MTLPRIAVIGGDERGERTAWPKGYSIRFFATKDRQNARKRIDEAITKGSYDLVVVMHWATDYNRSYGKVPTKFWSRGFGELAKELPKLIPPGDEDGTVDGDDRWYDKINEEVGEETAMDVTGNKNGKQHEAPAAPARKPQPKMKLEQAMALVQRDLELFADGLLDEADVVNIVGRILERGVER